MIRLRPHHLLCMLTYAGRGYTPRFTSGMDDLIARLGAGEEITIVDGPDDICAPWLAEAAAAATDETEIRAPHCHEGRITARDAKAADDVGSLLARRITAGSNLHLDAGLIDRLRQAFRDNVIRSGCAACEWKDFCDMLSAGDFAGCRLSARR
jgi:hypothetical protein